MLWFGKTSIIIHFKQGHAQVKLLDVANVPGVQFNPFSLYAVMPKCAVSLNAEGVHMVDGVWSILRGDAGSFVEAIRVVETPIAAVVLAPGKMRRIDVNDLHVSLAHSQADILRGTARQMGIKGFGELIPCAGCSEAKGKRTPVPSTTECVPPGLWSVSSCIYRGELNVDRRRLLADGVAVFVLPEI